MSREQDFHLADEMRERILSGPFLLSTEPPGRYLLDKASMCEALFDANGPMAAIAATASEITRSVIESRAQTGCIDVVSDLLEPVATQVVRKHIIGLHEDDYDDELLISLRTLAKLIIADDPQEPSLVDAARTASAFVSRLVHGRLESTAPIDSDMTARLGRTMGCDETVRLIVGLCGTATATIARAGGQAMNELLNRPRELASAHRFALDGEKEKILQYLLEALRFNPMFSFTPRRAVRDTTIVAEDRIYRIKAGSFLAVGLLPAMFDKTAFPEPRRFLLSRPRESYLHFGYGYHRCFGAPIAELQFKEIFTQLLSLRGIERNRREFSGQLRYSWPALTNLPIRWNRT
ncbi:MAG: cytochrome P450 [Pseudomonadota bacterium]